MSEQLNTETENTETDAEATVEMTDLQKLQAKFEKRSVVVVPSGADISTLSEMLKGFRPAGTEATDETQAMEELQDWTGDVEYESPTYLLAKTEGGEIRFAALPSKAVALADPIVQSKAYDWYIGRGALALKKEDSAAALFKSPAGFFLGFDMEAFRFQAQTWIDQLLTPKGAKVNPKRLRLILQSAAYAQALYNKVPQAFWQKLLNGMIERAEKHGHNPAQLQHWLATRDVTAADMPEFEWDESEVNAVTNAPDEAPPPADAKAPPAPATA